MNDDTGDPESPTADYTLADLWERGLEDLQDETATPGTTYEIAPGVVGTMPFPTLSIREDVRERERQIQALFREDATREDFEGMADSDDPSRQVESAASAVRPDVTTAEFNATIQKTACEVAARVLKTDEDVLPGDCVTDMAALVRIHFLGLAPGTTNGQETS